MMYSSRRIGWNRTSTRSRTTTRTSGSSRSTTRPSPTSRSIRLRRGPHPGRAELRWDEVFTDETERDIVSKADFAERNGAAGIDADTTVVVYGGGRVPNWFALFGYWIYTYYGHDDVRVIDGGKGTGSTTTTRSPPRRPTSRPASTRPAVPSRASARTRTTSTRRSRRDSDGRRALARGVLRRVIAPRAQRDGPARRLPSSRREQRPDRDHPERGRHVQRAPTSSASCTRTPASTATSRRSPTAASASARRSSGSCSTSCSATTTFATTTARGPSGEPRRSADRDRRVSGVRVRATAPSFIRDHLGRSQLFIYRIVATSVRYPLPSSIAAVPAVTATGSECVPAENFDSATGSGRRKSALR